MNTDRHRILIVDDDAGGRRLTRATLMRAGFEKFDEEAWMADHGGEARRSNRASLVSSEQDQAGRPRRELPHENALLSRWWVVERQVDWPKATGD